ncbi:PREDICTED: MICOS complex subunit MIC27 [Nanorana parkeri]|uniref:MICOS complex subunit MIC27 n=1 Tax=Nanorana parkeri TaxID=125878 RepID=UPI0008540721|nr:PREDICTED: MICOS complex subunit MIC27 [Nanorana parkeri]
MVSKIFKLAALPAGLALTSYSLYAVSDREPKGNRLSPHQLSVYSVPPRVSRFIEEEPGRVQHSVTAVRTTLSPIVTWGQSAGAAVKNGVVEAIQFTQDSYVYLKNPPPEFLPRLGVITISGLAGLVLARRGSRLKKVVYPVGLTALGVSVCYPAQAVIFAKVTGKKLYNASHWTYDSVSSLWQAKPQKVESSPTPAEEKEKPQTEEKTGETGAESTAGEPIGTEHTDPPTSPEPAQPPNTPDGSTGSVSPAAVKQSVFIPPPGLTDHGQSNPEDVDMYSTRT